MLMGTEEPTNLATDGLSVVVTAYRLALSGSATVPGTAEATPVANARLVGEFLSTGLSVESSGERCSPFRDPKTLPPLHQRPHRTNRRNVETVSAACAGDGSEP